uniref:Twisted gastrulation BMP signaling modulator 1 n=1 Tax=Bos taurus TaxID=9913 RepID=A0AAA9TAA4_BOVIN
MKSPSVVMLTLTVLVFLTWVPMSLSCNKALCASDVSKCLIQELCQCRPGEGNCSCCKECMLCLGTLWDECCDCVGMCNPRNYSDTPPTSKSTVEELHEPIPSLFRALTEGDTQLNWNIVSFPVAEELSHHENLVSFLETVNQPHHQNVSVPSNNVHAPYSSDKVMLAGWRQLQLCHLASEMRARRAEMRREGPPVLLVLLGLMEEAGECRDSLPEGPGAACSGA